MTIEPPAISRMVSSIAGLAAAQVGEPAEQEPAERAEEERHRVGAVAPISFSASFSPGKNWPAKKTTNVA